MLSKQLKSMHSFQIEDDRELPTPSIAVANNNYFSTTPTTLPTSSSSIGSSTDRRPLIFRDIFGFNNSPSSFRSSTDRRLLNFCDTFNHLNLRNLDLGVALHCSTSFGTPTHIFINPQRQQQLHFIKLSLRLYFSC